MCVYPVPISGAYFLGVHVTPSIDNYIKIGPSALPALSLENYKDSISSEVLKDMKTVKSCKTNLKSFGITAG